jgi:limonene-1,2-epoxide hydrolase
MPFVYPTTAARIRTIQPEYIAQDRAGRLGLEIMPIITSQFYKVRWNQADTYGGLQHLRGLDGKPTRVTRVGSTTYEYEPGVFGEFYDVTEQELTTRAGNFDIPTVNIDITDLATEADRILVQREDDRIESSIWTLLTTGVLQILLDSDDGTQIGYFDTYSFQSYTPLVPWSTVATATPIQDMQNLQQRGFAAGRSVNFGAGALIYVNQVTANRMLNNQNNLDLNGRRASMGATLNNLVGINQYFGGQNLANFRVYDNGYYNKPPKKGGVFKKFIPDGVGVLIGQRPGNVPIGNYLMVRNISNGGAPGSYSYEVDRANGRNGEKRTPANIEFHRGHNGGPAIYYPSAVVICNFGTVLSERYLVEKHGADINHLLANEGIEEVHPDTPLTAIAGSDLTPLINPVHPVAGGARQPVYLNADGSAARMEEVPVPHAPPPSGMGRVPMVDQTEEQRLQMVPNYPPAPGTQRSRERRRPRWSWIRPAGPLMAARPPWTWTTARKPLPRAPPRSPTKRSPRRLTVRRIAAVAVTAVSRRK